MSYRTGQRQLSKRPKRPEASGGMPWTTTLGRSSQSSPGAKTFAPVDVSLDIEGSIYTYTYINVGRWISEGGVCIGTKSPVGMNPHEE